MAFCSFDGCHRPRKSSELCSGHASQMARAGMLRPIVERGPRSLLSNPQLPGTLLVPLTRGEFAIIDEADGPSVSHLRWQLFQDRTHRSKYAMCSRSIDGRSRFLHTRLWQDWGMPPAPHLDHRNRDGLDCRRENIRAATSVTNGQNRAPNRGTRSGRKGVTLMNGKWVARIVVDRKRRNLGTFDTIEEAAEAYAVAARESFGEFARVA